MCVLWLQSQNRALEEEWHEQTADCGHGQLWQEELPLGWEGQAGQRDAELGVH